MVQILVLTCLSLGILAGVKGATFAWIAGAVVSAGLGAATVLAADAPWLWVAAAVGAYNAALFLALLLRAAKVASLRARQKNAKLPERDVA